jgi:hypothetical protein
MKGHLYSINVLYTQVRYSIKLHSHKSRVLVCAAERDTAFVQTHTHTHICMYMYVYICMYIYIYIYII